MKSNIKYNFWFKNMHNIIYCNYQYNVVFGNHTHMIMLLQVRLESIQFILVATDDTLENFISQDIFFYKQEEN